MLEANDTLLLCHLRRAPFPFEAESPPRTAPHGRPRRLPSFESRVSESQETSRTSASRRFTLGAPDVGVIDSTVESIVTQERSKLRTPFARSPSAPVLSLQRSKGGGQQLDLARMPKQQGMTSGLAPSPRPGAVSFASFFPPPPPHKQAQSPAHKRLEVVGGVCTHEELAARMKACLAGSETLATMRQRKVRIVEEAPHSPSPMRSRRKSVHIAAKGNTAAQLRRISGQHRRSSIACVDMAALTQLLGGAKQAQAAMGGEAAKVGPDGKIPLL